MELELEVAMSCHVGKFWEQNPGLLPEQQVLSATELSPAP